MDLQQLARQIEHFLAEDIGLGDITTESVFPLEKKGRAVFVAKEDFVVAGLVTVAPLVFATRNREIACEVMQDDGDTVKAGATIFAAMGPVRDLLSAERLALNLVQRMSGIATLTAEFVARVADLPVKIVDTRKTTPGLRSLEKYAVRMGGGHNHRFSLADGILIKDNHIAACGSISRAVQTVRATAPHTLRIEVETENLAQVDECLASGVDIIMLDNMPLPLMRQAVERISGRCLVEASGGVNLDNVRQIAETGVDLISVGALTHSARAMDISMRLSLLD
ncbi:carboxylating nicotinate-nucleotide diphosphorylase [Thiovibrio sp. JS02]